ncbi:MAG TPA: hypothetical protein VIY86_15310 [Pirellulaceae bacterium]
MSRTLICLMLCILSLANTSPLRGQIGGSTLSNRTWFYDDNALPRRRFVVIFGTDPGDFQNNTIPVSLTVVRKSDVQFDNYGITFKQMADSDALTPSNRRTFAADQVKGKDNIKYNLRLIWRGFSPKDGENDSNVVAREQVSILIIPDVPSCQEAREEAKRRGVVWARSACDPDSELLISPNLP